MTIDEATILVMGATDGRGRRVVHGRAAQGTAVLLHGRIHKRVDTQAHDRAARAIAGADRAAMLADRRTPRGRARRTTHRQGALP